LRSCSKERGARSRKCFLRRARAFVRVARKKDRDATKGEQGGQQEGRTGQEDEGVFPREKEERLCHDQWGRNCGDSVDGGKRALQLALLVVGRRA